MHFLAIVIFTILNVVISDPNVTLLREACEGILTQCTYYSNDASDVYTHGGVILGGITEVTLDDGTTVIKENIDIHLDKIKKHFGLENQAISRNKFVKMVRNLYFNYVRDLVNPVQPFKLFCEQHIQNARLDPGNMFYTIFLEMRVRFL